MKIFLIVAVTVAILGGYAFSQIVSERQAGAQRPNSANSKAETPVLLRPDGPHAGTAQTATGTG